MLYVRMQREVNLKHMEQEEREIDDTLKSHARVVFQQPVFRGNGKVRFDDRGNLCPRFVGRGMRQPSVVGQPLGRYHRPVPAKQLSALNRGEVHLHVARHISTRIPDGGKHLLVLFVVLQLAHQSGLEHITLLELLATGVHNLEVVVQVGVLGNLDAIDDHVGQFLHKLTLVLMRELLDILPDDVQAADDILLQMVGVIFVALVGEYGPDVAQRIVRLVATRKRQGFLVAGVQFQVTQQQEQRSKTLLSVDDLILTVAFGYNQRTDIVVLAKADIVYVFDELYYLLFLPGVITLVERDAVSDRCEYRRLCIYDMQFRHLICFHHNRLFFARVYTGCSAPPFH